MGFFSLEVMETAKYDTQHFKKKHFSYYNINNFIHRL